MTEPAHRISGITLSRAMEAAGGVWSIFGIARACGVARQTVEATWSHKDDFPYPVLIYGGRRWRAWAGEDVLDWLEATQRFHSAEKFHEAIQANRAELRKLAREGNDYVTDQARSERNRRAAKGQGPSDSESDEVQGSESA